MRPIFPVICVAACLALPVPRADAETVEFTGIPTTAEILHTLSPDLVPASMSRSSGPYTPRTIRDTSTGADVTQQEGDGTDQGMPGPDAASVPRGPHRRLHRAVHRGIITQPVNFRPGSAELPTNARSMLDVMADAMRQVSSLNLLITGHTDSMGNPDANEALSQRRANAARTYLVGHGVDPARVTAIGLGTRSPLPGLPPTSPANRRIAYAARPGTAG